MENLLEVKNLCAGYGGVNILRNVSFSLGKNEILGIVGESGCGKSTLIKALSQLKGLNAGISNGQILYNNVDLVKMPEKDKIKLRGKEISMIFQNPEASLNPIRRIGVQFYETIRAHEKMSEKEMDVLIEKMFLSVGLSDIKRIKKAYPFELSGGMAQRVAIALAMIMKPKLILADEPTSALDTTIQKQVIEELLNLRSQMNTAMIIITHNIGVVRKMADTIGVMYGGRIVEYGPVEKVLAKPVHPYTKALIAAVPKLDGSLPVGLAGRPPRFTELKEGCSFCDRCPFVKEDCREYDNLPKRISDNHFTVCYREDVYDVG